MLRRIIGPLCFIFYLAMSGCGGSGDGVSFPSNGIGLSTTTPSNVTVEAGQTATFSTTASGGTIPYSYHWQVLANGSGGFTDIPGATSSSYTTGVLSDSNDGSQYRVVVTDAVSNSVTSNAATLTVNTVDVNKINQTITFTSTPPLPSAVGGTYTVTATGGGSGNSVVFSIDGASSAGACNISANLVSFTDAGTCIIDANQAGNADYNAAAQAQQSIAVVVNKADQTITLTSTPANPAVGGTYTVSATGGASGNPVVFSIDGASSAGACSINGNLVSFANTGTCIINANQAGNSNFNAAAQEQQVVTVNKADQTITFTSTPTDPAVGGTYTVTATGGASGNSVVFSIDAGSSSGACSINGNLVSFTDTGTCIIDADQAGNSNYNAATQAQQTISNLEILPAPHAPTAVKAVPDAGQVTVSWLAPAYTGGSPITGYTVSYGLTGSPTNYNLVASNCNPTSALSCVVTGLSNSTEYSFKVTAGSNHGTAAYLAGYSSPVSPIDALAINPSTLALSSLGSGGTTRVVTLTNTSSSPITLNALPATYADFNPNLPNDVTIGTTCTTSTPLNANGGSCTISITPGTTASNNVSSAPCTDGTAPVPSTFQVSPGYSINAVVLGYGCQYQGGYLFAVDDSTSSMGNIGGLVAAITPQSNVVWSPTLDVIWGIDDSSAPAAPSPNTASTFPSTLALGQTNCNGSNDGACNSNNLVAFPGYGTGTNYAAGICHQSIDSAGNSPCQGGNSCYSDWYLPSICEMDDQFISPDNQSCALTQSMQSTIGTLLQFDNFWSSTEYSILPDAGAYNESFNPGSSSGTSSPFFKTSFNIGAWCVRRVTL